MNKYAYKIPFLSIRYFRNYLDAKLFPAQETLNAAVRRVCEADGAITIPDRFDK
jgi:hypothetical protein